MGPLSEFVRKLMDERKATKASPGRARKLLQDPGSGSGIAVSAGGIARLLTMVSLILEQDADMGRAIDLMVIGSGGDIMDFFTQIGSLLVITGPEVQCAQFFSMQEDCVEGWIMDNFGYLPPEVRGDLTVWGLSATMTSYVYFLESSCDNCNPDERLDRYEALDVLGDTFDSVSFPSCDAPNCPVP